MKEGVLAIYKYHPDLVFLDIEMPEEDGFKIFNYFQQIDFSVIFITAYKEYAIKAIKVAALDYILKPVNVNDLKEALALYEKSQLPGIPVESIGKLFHAPTTSSTITEKDSSSDLERLPGGKGRGNHVLHGRPELYQDFYLERRGSSGFKTAEHGLEVASGASFL